MTKATLLFTSLFFLLYSCYAQNTMLEHTDQYLASNFEAFNSVDTELGYCMGKIIEERVVAELKDSTTFHYSFDSLAKYINIQTAESGLLRTFSWNKRSGGSWHDMAAHVQYKTDSGTVKHQNLSSGEEDRTGEPTGVIIYAVHTIDIKNKSHYLLLGWGTYGGGKHHSLARVYTIAEDSLQLHNSMFNGEKYLYAEANRGDKIELEYDQGSNTLSYYKYKLDEDTGFYEREGRKEKWVLEREVFVKQE